MLLGWGYHYSVRHPHHHRRYLTVYWKFVAYQHQRRVFYGRDIHVSGMEVPRRTEAAASRPGHPENAQHLTGPHPDPTRGLCVSGNRLRLHRQCFSCKLGVWLHPAPASWYEYVASLNTNVLDCSIHSHNVCVSGHYSYLRAL